MNFPGGDAGASVRATGQQTPLTVARAGALRRPREQSAEPLNFPEAMRRICPGLYDYSVRKNRPVLSDGGPDA
ncbi:hypothetical protein, partial [Klebsiella michiganensis]|uniref:hypothetical protein n=1 Tax=Klebsiella michiganensis TaxID=1134687 RepID=UPI001C8B59BA